MMRSSLTPLDLGDFLIPLTGASLFHSSITHVRNETKNGNVIETFLAAIRGCWGSSCGSILQQAALKQLLLSQRRVKRKHGQRQHGDDWRQPYPGVPHREVERDREIIQHVSSK